VKKATLMLMLCIPAVGFAADPGKDAPAACAAQAKAWFKDAYGDGKKALKNGRTVQASYVAHYNVRRKQCLVRVTSDTPAQDKSPAVSNVSVREIDTKERKSLVSIVRVGGAMKYCVVEGKKCSAEQDWEKLAAPLMKE